MTNAEPFKRAVMSSIGARHNLADALGAAFSRGQFDEDLNPRCFAPCQVAGALQDAGLGVTETKVQRALERCNRFRNMNADWYGFTQ